MGSNVISTQDRELNRIVEEQARALGTSKSEVVRTLLRRGLGWESPPALPNPGPRFEQRTQAVWNDDLAEEEEFAAPAGNPGPTAFDGIPLGDWTKALADAWLRDTETRIEAVERQFDEIPRLKALAEELRKDIENESWRERIDALIQEEEKLKKAFDELSVKVSEWEKPVGRTEEPEKVPESPPDSELIGGLTEDQWVAAFTQAYRKALREDIERAEARMQAREKPTLRHGHVPDGRKTDLEILREQARKFEPLRDLGYVRAHRQYPSPPESRLRAELDTRESPPMEENGRTLDLPNATLLPRGRRSFWDSVALWGGGLAGLFGMWWLVERLGWVDLTPQPARPPGEIPL